MKQLEGNSKNEFVKITFVGCPNQLKKAKIWCLQNNTSISIEFRKFLEKLSQGKPAN